MNDAFVGWYHVLVRPGGIVVEFCITLAMMLEQLSIAFVNISIVVDVVDIVVVVVDKLLRFLVFSFFFK